MCVESLLPKEGPCVAGRGAALGRDQERIVLRRDEPKACREHPAGKVQRDGHGKHCLGAGAGSATGAAASARASRARPWQEAGRRQGAQGLWARTLNRRVCTSHSSCAAHRAPLTLPTRVRARGFATRRRPRAGAAESCSRLASSHEVFICYLLERRAMPCPCTDPSAIPPGRAPPPGG